MGRERGVGDAVARAPRSGTSASRAPVGLEQDDTGRRVARGAAIRGARRSRPRPRGRARRASRGRCAAGIMATPCRPCSRRSAQCRSRPHAKMPVEWPSFQVIVSPQAPDQLGADRGERLGRARLGPDRAVLLAQPATLCARAVEPQLLQRERRLRSVGPGQGEPVLPIELDRGRRLGVRDVHGHDPSLAHVRPGMKCGHERTAAGRRRDRAVAAVASGWERHGDEIRSTSNARRSPTRSRSSFASGSSPRPPNHHPDLDIRWRNVVVAPHDARCGRAHCARSRRWPRASTRRRPESWRCGSRSA